MDDRFLNIQDIQDFNEIIDDILNKGISEDVLAIEHIGDIIYMLNKSDKKCKDDLELKQAVFTIIKALIDSKRVELFYEWSWVKEVQKTPPIGERAVFDYLDKYWAETDGIGLDREYLLWFKKIN